MKICASWKYNDPWLKYPPIIVNTKNGVGIAHWRWSGSGRHTNSNMYCYAGQKA